MSTRKWQKGESGRLVRGAFAEGEKLLQQHTKVKRQISRLPKNKLSEAQQDQYLLERYERLIEMTRMVEKTAWADREPTYDTQCFHKRFGQFAVDDWLSVGVMILQDGRAASISTGKMMSMLDNFITAQRITMHKVIVAAKVIGGFERWLFRRMEQRNKFGMSRRLWE